MKEGKTNQTKSTGTECVVRFLSEVFPFSALIRVYLCASVVPNLFSATLCLRGNSVRLPDERQLRGAGAAGGLEVRDRVACVETHAGTAILQTGSVPRRGNRLHAARGDSVLRCRVGGIGADAEVHQRGILDGHAHAVDRRNDRGPRHGVHRELLLNVIWMGGHKSDSIPQRFQRLDAMVCDW